MARRATLTALAVTPVNPALLIMNLGRPKRLLNMLRMFKVTSPMSVGVWILSAQGGAAATLAGSSELTGRAPATLAGAAYERWAIFRARFQSARDPKYTVVPQRRRVDERRRATADGAAS